MYVTKSKCVPTNLMVFELSDFPVDIEDAITRIYENDCHMADPLSEQAETRVLIVGLFKGEQFYSEPSLRLYLNTLNDRAGKARL